MKGNSHNLPKVPEMTVMPIVRKSPTAADGGLDILPSRRSARSALARITSAAWNCILENINRVTGWYPSLNQGVLSVKIPRHLDKFSPIYGPFVKTWRPGLVRGQGRRLPTVHRGSTTPHASSGHVASGQGTRSERILGAALACHPETPVIEPCQSGPTKPLCAYHKRLISKALSHTHKPAYSKKKNEANLRGPG